MFRKYRRDQPLANTEATATPVLPKRMTGQHDGTVPRPSPPHGRTGRPPVTSRAQILAAARQLIDRDGWEKLTIRRLAAETGIGVDDPVPPRTGQGRPAAPAAQRIRGARSRAPTCPASHGTASSPPPPRCTTPSQPGRGPPRSSQPTVSSASSANRPCGWSKPSWPEPSTTDAHPYRPSTPSAASGTTPSARSSSARTPPADGTDDERPWRDIDFSNFDPSRLPRLAALGDQWPALASRDTYPQGLRAFVDGLLAQARPAAP